MNSVKSVSGIKRIAGDNNQLLNPFIILEGLNVGEGKVVADLGCGGVGYFVFAAAELVGDKGLVYAVDILKPNLEAIQSKARQDKIYNIRTIWSNLEVFEGTKIPTASVDIILLISVLFQSKKHKEVLHEAHRLLKRSGILAIIDWRSKIAPFGPPSGYRLDKEKIINLSLLSGFRLKEQFEAGKYHYALKFIKL